MEGGVDSALWGKEQKKARQRENEKKKGKRFSSSGQGWTRTVLRWQARKKIRQVEVPREGGRGRGGES